MRPKTPDGYADPSLRDLHLIQNDTVLFFPFLIYVKFNCNVFVIYVAIGIPNRLSQLL